MTGDHWLLCDYGEVLCLAPVSEDRDALVAVSGWDPDRGDFWAAYWADRAAYDRGDINPDDYWAGVLGQPPGAELLGRLNAADATIWHRPNLLSVAAVNRAARRGLRLAILSNAPVVVAEAIDRAGWVAPFSRRFFSCYLRAIKPEPAAYQEVLAALGARPEQVTFFDDRPPNVAGAAALGIDARHFTDPAQLDEVTPG